MLYFIFTRLGTVLEWLGKIVRSTDAIEKRQSRIEEKQDQLLLASRKQILLLEEIRDNVVPGQAVELVLTAGPTEEQPK